MGSRRVHLAWRQAHLTGIEMTLSRRYSYKGKRRSYISAGCPAPKGLRSLGFPLAKTSFSFAKGGTLSTVVEQTCRAQGQVRRPAPAVR